jgi:hypothetical protein
VLPLPMQALFTQQPPPLQLVPAQHVSPAPPQAIHTLLRQTALVLQAVPVVQQACPGPPQLEAGECPPQLQELQKSRAQNAPARKVSRVIVNLVKFAPGAANFPWAFKAHRSRQIWNTEARSHHSTSGSGQPKVTPFAHVRAGVRQYEQSDACKHRMIRERRSQPDDLRLRAEGHYHRTVNQDFCNFSLHTPPLVTRYRKSAAGRPTGTHSAAP